MGSSALTYQYEIDVEDQSAPAKVVRLVGTNKRVLELGSGPGSITRHLVKNGCQVTALDLDPESIDIVSSMCERAFVVDLNQENCLSCLQEGVHYDVIVLADVLEHLYDPANLLRQIKPFFHDETTMIVSLPHVANNGVIAALMNGDFAYFKWGLLDNTHIRFYCLKNMQDLFESSGYKILEAEYVLMKPEKTELASHWNSLSEQSRTVLSENDAGEIYQVVMRIVPASRADNSINLVNHWRNIKAQSDIKLIAFHLPQFHPTPENDRWWGKGFTEWTNVTKAKPLFPGHYQPHLPSDLGFYDLRLKEARDQQIELAKAYGIQAFCYHYYWFSGQRLLNRPIDEMFNDKSADMPYCFCWANENWTRRWDGQDQAILIQQEYNPEDPLHFIQDLIKYFQDPRYLKFEGKPFLIVYRPQSIPNVLKTVNIWRDYCRSIGLGEIHLCAALTHANQEYLPFGFDSGVQFPPHNLNIHSYNKPHSSCYRKHKGVFFDYARVADDCLESGLSQENVFLTVCPSWDNTARTNDRSLVLLNASPEHYESWLSRAIQGTQKMFPNQERFVFINAWNEWAEGCHLEPDREYGHAYLKATVNAKHDPWRERKVIYLKESFNLLRWVRSTASVKQFLMRVRPYILANSYLKALLRPFWKVYVKLC